jgi:hypothetical protein
LQWQQAPETSGQVPGAVVGEGATQAAGFGSGAGGLLAIAAVLGIVFMSRKARR